MMLKDKVAVIYGAAGGIGSAVARGFAREGAQVFLTGRTLEPLEALARELVSNQAVAHAAQVDACDEQAIDRHLQQVIERAGRVDISFNAAGISSRSVVGTPLVDMPLEQFALPIASYTNSYFLTSRRETSRPNWPPMASVSLVCDRRPFPRHAPSKTRSSLERKPPA